jgi:zinc transport system ATP-binding protein
MTAPAAPAAPAHRHAEACVHDHGHHHHHHAPSTPPDTSALISARGLSLGRRGINVLDHIDIDIRPGEIVTLIGPNGAGKTTLVRLLLGLEQADRGTILRQPGLVIGYAPQRFDLDRAIPMTVARFLALAQPPPDADFKGVLAEVGAAKLIHRQISELSGGELQRVILARALVRQPQLVVLDEPVRGVDYLGEADLYQLISRIRDERGLGVLLVSHDLHVVMASSDRVICLNRHVCCSGVPETVAQHPEYVRLFGTQASAAFAVYHHHHDHEHDLAGRPVPAHNAPDAADPGESSGSGTNP